MDQRQEQIEQLRRKISGLVREIVVLSTSGVAPEEFFHQFLARVLAAMQAVAGAVWYAGLEGQLRLGAAANLETIRFADFVRPAGEPGAAEAGPGLSEEEARKQFVLEAVATVLRQKKPAVLGPSSGEESAGPPLLVTPILAEEQAAGALLVAPRPGTDPRALRGMVAFMSEVCRQAGVYIQQQRLRAMARLQEHSQQVVALLEQAHAALDPVRVAFALANMGQTIVGCDRLSVVALGGRKARVLAVSGHDIIQRRSVLVKRQSALARRVCAWKQTLRQPPPPESKPPPRRVAEALAAYAETTTMRSLVVMPLAPEGAPVGALVAESKADEALTGEHVARLTSVARHGGPALANALRYHRLPFLRALGVVKGLFGRLLGRSVPRVLFRLALVSAPVLALVFVPWQLAMQGPATVGPEVTRTAYAQTEGTVREVLVREGEHVTAGQVLARMHDSSLQAKLKAERAQLAVQESRLRALEASSDPRSIGQANIQRHVVAYQQASVAYLERELEKTETRAPIDGTVLTQRPEELLEKPVRRGEELFRIAQLTGPWVVEIDLPEKEAGHILAAGRRLGRPLTVTFYLAAFPQRRFKTDLREVAPQATIVNQKNVIRLTADLPPDVTNVKPQMRGEARILCGKRALGYVLFHGVIDFIHTHLAL